MYGRVTVFDTDKLRMLRRSSLTRHSALSMIARHPSIQASSARWPMSSLLVGILSETRLFSDGVSRMVNADSSAQPSS